MHAFDVLGDPVRRRIVELLARGERAAGEISLVVQKEFGISQPAVSQQLRVLRDSGFATVRAEGTRRLYLIDPAPLREVSRWADRNRRHWEESFDALADHLAALQGKPKPSHAKAAGKKKTAKRRTPSSARPEPKRRRS